MGPNALKYILNVARKSLVKDQGSGIMKVPGRMDAEAKASEIVTRLTNAGLDLGKMDDFIRSEADVAKYLNILEAAKRERMRPIPADSPEGRRITEQLFGKRGEVVDMTGKKIDTRKGIMGGKSIEDLMDSGQVTKGTVTKKSKKVTDREMFKAANERLTSDVDSIIKNIKSMEPITAMKEANSVIARKGKYKNLTPEQSKKILQDTEDHIFERNIPEDPEDFAQGGIARANFVGGGMGRRGFLKMLAGLGGGIAAAKTGLLKLAGKEPAKQVAKEVVQKSTTGSPPPYFFKLAEKIKMMGDDATATTDRTIAKTLKSKDGKSTYVLEEDVATGDTIIKKVNKEGDEMMTDVEIMELKKGEVVMGKDGRPVKVPDEYEEVTEVNARIEGDTFNDPYFVDGIKIDEIIKEVGEQAPSIKKAGGGIARLGYQMGGDVAYDATDSIYGSSAITVTPDTVMGPGGNQIQDKMGKPGLSSLIPPGGAKKIGGPYIPPQGPPTSVQTPDPFFGKGANQLFNFTLPKTPISMQTPLPGMVSPITGMPLPPGGIANMPLRPGAEPEQLTGDALVKSIQGEMTNRRAKAPYEQAYYKDVLDTGGYPTKTLQQYQKEIGAGKLELDLPNLGGNNNQMGILPVMPPKSEYYTGKNYGPGNQAYSAVMPQPGMRYVYDEKGTRYSVPIEDYEGPTSGTPLAQELKSQQLAANYGDSPLASTVRTNMLSGGIARMLGE